jgi:short subunit dehydrogenase-like uncharacterized protein
MPKSAEFDVVVYGATGYTGRLVAEYMARRYPAGGEVRWALAGRNPQKLAGVVREIGADVPLITADAGDPASIEAMAARTRVVLTTVGPYSLYGEPLVAACAKVGTDYVDLTGETLFMHRMINAHEAAAKASGARICFSCGFDSIPFELGVIFMQEQARKQLGAPVHRAKGRVRGLRGGLSGGTAASGRAMMLALQADPSLMPVLMDPFALTPGFSGPPQPPGQTAEFDKDLGVWVAPFMMAAINTRNVHRANFLLGHPWGADFTYDEMTITEPPKEGEAPAAPGFSGGFEGGPQPGEGPTPEERAAGHYDILIVGIAEDARQVRVSVSGTEDPGYASTSKMLAECAVCLAKDDVAAPGGMWVPGAAMGDKLVRRLEQNAGIAFRVE